MAKAPNSAAKAADITTASTPASADEPNALINMADYTQVTVLKTDTVGGHLYRRGQQPYVDADTLKAMQSAGMI